MYAVIWFSTFLVMCSSQPENFSDVFSVILDNPATSYSGIYQWDEEKVVTYVDSLKIRIQKVSTLYRDVNAWTYFPLIIRLKESEANWYMFLDERTHTNYNELKPLLEHRRPTEVHFLGRILHDAEPTIRHHFDGVEGDKYLNYPDQRAGFLLSKAALRKIAANWLLNDTPHDFSIDAPYELAKFAARLNIYLEDYEKFCSDQNQGCLSWFNRNFQCKKISQSTISDIHFAIKTCSKFIPERIPFLQATWLPEAQNSALYSDANDVRVGAISLGVPNVEVGHCGKTLAIIKHVAKNLPALQWLAIVDDDTLISPHRLVTYLQCFKPTEFVAIGERYGFQATGKNGFDYITGGGGMVFSYPLVKKLAESCSCPADDTPDDMLLGSCLHRFKIPITHSDRFHQARPEDYPESVLEKTSPISFHKFWMIDPKEVYEKYLKHSFHDEL